jgi:hypothetical protein
MCFPQGRCGRSRAAHARAPRELELWVKGLPPPTARTVGAARRSGSEASSCSFEEATGRARNLPTRGDRIHKSASSTNNRNSLTDYRYDFLPSFENKGAGEHGLAHPLNADFQAAGANITPASSTRDRVRIRRWFFGQMKTVLDRLSSTADGSGSLMDNTTVLFASEFGGPNANGGGQHSNRNLPYMLIGGKNSPFSLGKSMNVTRPHGDYLLTLAKGFGSNVSAVGKGTSTIDGILK